MIKTITLQCDNCKKDFDRSLSEYKTSDKGLEHGQKMLRSVALKYSLYVGSTPAYHSGVRISTSSAESIYNRVVFRQLDL